MTALTVEQRQILAQSKEEPPRLLDPETKQEYVLVKAEVYDQLRSMLGDANPGDLYPALHRALASEGWDDPQMDEYNRYG